MVLTSPGQALGSPPDAATPGAALVNATQRRFPDRMLGARPRSRPRIPVRRLLRFGPPAGVGCFRSKARIDVRSERS